MIRVYVTRAIKTHVTQMYICPVCFFFVFFLKKKTKNKKLELQSGLYTCRDFLHMAFHPGLLRMGILV